MKTSMDMEKGATNYWSDLHIIWQVEPINLTWTQADSSACQDFKDKTTKAV